MLVVARFTIDSADAVEFVAKVEVAVEALKSRPGHLSSRLARAMDEPDQWTLISEWDSVGNYRRALGKPEVRLASMPLAGLTRDEPTSYEILWDDETGSRPSDLS